MNKITRLEKFIFINYQNSIHKKGGNAPFFYTRKTHFNIGLFYLTAETTTE